IVPNTDVLDQGAQLQVGRYIVPSSTKRLLSLMKSARTVGLGEVTKTIRPMPTATENEDTMEVLEIGVSELPPRGYIDTPGRTVSITRETAEKNAEQFLRPLDIVLIIKGSVGKIGIIPPH